MWSSDGASWSRLCAVAPARCVFFARAVPERSVFRKVGIQKWLWTVDVAHRDPKLELKFCSRCCAVLFFMHRMRACIDRIALSLLRGAFFMGAKRARLLPVRCLKSARVYPEAKKLIFDRQTVHFASSFEWSFFSRILGRLRGLPVSKAIASCKSISKASCKL